VRIKKDTYEDERLLNFTGIVTLADVWLSSLDPLVFCSQTFLNYLAFKYFDIEG
jgi:hypothetical protein